MKKHIVFIGNTAWGMYNFRKLVFSHLISLEYHVTIIAPHDNDYETLLKSIGCNYISIKIDAKGNNPINDIFLLLKIFKTLISIKPDICFFYTIKPNIYGSIAAALLRIPFIPITTGLGYIFLKNNWISKIAKFLYKIAFFKAKQVWFLNEDDVLAFKQEHLVAEHKIRLLKGEGIDLNHFETHHRPQEISFLLIARMLWDKGIGEFVEASKIIREKYPDTKCKLLGFLGIENPNAISQKQMDLWVKNGIVEYLGATKDVRPYIYASTCIVLPSFYREGIPFSLMEGAASGKPLIASNFVGCKEVVKDGTTGFLCKIKDANDLANCMEKIISLSEEERIKMGAAGRQKMKNEFDIKYTINKYVDTIRAVTE